ncbi:uncharacterized protein EI90DRAFT_3117074 [Cantharellus anzutake]|uniref:uncharacterized protein n=1 Tax=Cantharellus anzutake TaxID=1750568 RepID=UPI001905E058|nr:uncharacterized protein EI90DRAFT_3117074 [Cantharellus anzutake]KAF8340555.1 hypothetical protein EI90DRAFT_3117074 [Cantharellus anzutake]
MSSTSPPSSSSSSATPSASNPSSSSTDGSQSPASSSLYLFTFLTTLLLLLAVSCGIVLRSFILRRRFRRRVEAAIAAGVLLPEQVDALRRRAPVIGEKPKLHEVRIDGGYKEDYEPSSSATRDEDWSNIMPVSAAIIPGNKSQSRPNNPVPLVDPRATAASPRNTRSRFRWFRHSASHSPSILPMTAPPPPASSIPMADGTLTPPAQPTPAQPSSDDVLQLTVLIAMPNVNVRARRRESSHSKGKEASNDEEEEIPEVVFGTTEVRWNAGADWKPDLPDGPSEPKSEESAVHLNDS